MVLECVDSEDSEDSELISNNSLLIYLSEAYPAVDWLRLIS